MDLILKKQQEAKLLSWAIVKRQYKLILLLTFLVYALLIDSIAAMPKSAKGPQVPTCLHSLIGNNIRTPVYAFITNFLLVQKPLSPQRLHLLIQQEKYILTNNNKDQQKSYMAEVSESIMSHILRHFRDSAPTLQEITLYQRQGLAVASTDMKNAISFSEDPALDIAVGYLGDQPTKQLGIKKLIDRDGKEYQEVIMAIHWDKQTGSNLSLNLPNKSQQTIGYLRTIIQMSYLPLGAIIGDNTNTEVYPFIIDFLLQQESILPNKLHLIVEEERSIGLSRTSNLSNTYMDHIKNTEMSHILLKLRDSAPTLQEITLYQRQGLAVASTGMKSAIFFSEDPEVGIGTGYLGDLPTKQLGIKKLIARDGKEYQEVIIAIHWDRTNSWENYRAGSLSFSPAQQHEQTIGYLRAIIHI